MQNIKDLSHSRRFALLLSNTYEGCETLPSLKHRNNNASALADTLREKGFDVVSNEENLSAKSMTQVMEFFLAYVSDAKAQTTEEEEVTTFFYFSGYGGRSVEEDASVVYDKEGNEFALHRNYYETVSALKGAHILVLDCVNKPLVTTPTYFKSHISLGNVSLFIFALACPYDKQPVDVPSCVKVSPFTQCLVSTLDDLHNTDLETVAKLTQIEFNRLYNVLSFYCIRYSSLTHDFRFRNEPRLVQK